MRGGGRETRGKMGVSLGSGRGVEARPKPCALMIDADRLLFFFFHLVLCQAHRVTLYEEANALILWAILNAARFSNFNEIMA